MLCWTESAARTLTQHLLLCLLEAQRFFLGTLSLSTSFNERVEESRLFFKVAFKCARCRVMCSKRKETTQPPDLTESPGGISS